MKTSLEHLPGHKQDELQAVVELICQSKLRPKMIILFGSYARGDWVHDVYQDERGTTYEYQSDYDLLIVVETPKQVSYRAPWRKLEKRFLEWSRIQTPVSLMGIDIDSLNHELLKGQYFYTDIKKEGVLLYDSEQFQLAEVKKLSPKERQNEAKKHFEHWFSSANEFHEHFQFSKDQKYWSKAAFMLHQMVENLYATILLVFTDYRPKLHDLKELEALADSQFTGVGAIFPQSTEEQKRLFELLRRAYVDGRYNEKYQITKEELEWLAERVEKLQELTAKICQEKIESFGSEMEDKKKQQNK